MRNAERFGERIVLAERAYTLVVVQGRPLREAATALGLSHVTVGQYVRAYRVYLDRRC